MNKSIKAVTIGDIEGIGLKLLVKLWKTKRKKIGKFILVSNFNLFKNYIKKNNINVPYIKISDLSNINKIYNSYLPIFNIDAKNNVHNTYNSIISAYCLNKLNICCSLITLPINKEKIIKKIDINENEDFSL